MRRRIVALKLNAPQDQRRRQNLPWSNLYRLTSLHVEFYIYLLPQRDLSVRIVTEP